MPAILKKRFDLICREIPGEFWHVQNGILESATCGAGVHGGFVDEGVRALFPYTCCQSQHQGLREYKAPRRVQVGLHTVCVDYEVPRYCAQQRQQFAGRKARLCQPDPFRFPGAAVSLMVVNQAFRDERRVVADDAGECSEVLGDLRVALVRHGNAANCACHEPLAYLVDFGALQVVNLVPNLVAGGGNQRQQIEPFSQCVTGGRPRNRWDIQTEPHQEAPLQFQRTRPKRRKATNSACVSARTARISSQQRVRGTSSKSARSSAVPQEFW